jgi:SAM-dependent methyltransferase
MRPYQLLAKYYRRDWTAYGLQYAALVPAIASKHSWPIHSVVDLACGIGALAVELKHSGYDVLGVDLSPEMLAVARAADSEIPYILGDLTSVLIPRPVDLAICGFDSLNYLTDPAVLRNALSNVRTMLKTGAFFTFDVNTPRLYEEIQVGTITREVSGVVFRQILKYDPDHRLSTTTFDFGDGQQEIHLQRALSTSEVRDHLNAVGFGEIDIYDGFDMKAGGSESPKPVFVARNGTP